MKKQNKIEEIGGKKIKTKIYAKTKEKIIKLLRKLGKRLFRNRIEFEERNARALRELIQMVLKENILIAEIGSWKGLSTAVLAKAIADHNGKVFAIDHWMGNEGVPLHKIAKTKDIYSIFKRNMISSGVWNIVYPLVMDSQTASKIFRDGILDLVFIDADHRYESVKKDISSWLPKLKKGGILSGHDCEGYYSKYPKEIQKIIDEHCGEAFMDVSPRHPGVVKALYDCFQDRHSIMPNSVIWYIKK